MFGMVLVAAVLPAFVLLYYIWRKDKYQQEPPRQLLKGFVYGMGSALLVLLMPAFGLIEGSAATSVSAQIGNAFSTAAIPEELAKLLMLWLLLRRNPYFDEHMDGIVYAVSVGMGFAATENILYLFSNMDCWVSVGISRALISVPAHYFFAVLMGYYYSLAHFRMGESKTRDTVFALLIPVLAHGCFDALLFISESADISETAAFLVMLLFLIGFHRLFRFAQSRIAILLKSDDPSTPDEQREFNE